ncbi:MAG: HPr(Ser) kinase/phosphatase [Candidatus Izemoplasmatales bacterium]|nr:HPr(Ser) kinase/phosphatase [Candidatus Izemoplasmatales bacterium]MDD4595138.1 HPr(Ser) kinase/phosphatase [Candidatus Izemoplasmatales bacterium]
MSQKLTVSQIVDNMKLEVLAGALGLNREVTSPNLTKPGLELAGLFDYYEYNRIQIIGTKEVTFFNSLALDVQSDRVQKLFAQEPPAFVFSKNVDIPELFLRFGNEYKIPVLKSTYQTTSLFGELFNVLQAKLAERTTIHGVLMDINGVGTIITGSSGIGKSEVALELIRRGYMLVADDTVEIYQREKNVLIGEAPDVLKKYLEIRGIGIVNVVYMFGVSAYRETKRVSLIVRLDVWDDNKQYDRLGLQAEKQIIFDTEVVSMSLPITEARNTATLVEAAAFDFKAKQMGYHSAEDFSSSLKRKIKANSEKK